MSMNRIQWLGTLILLFVMIVIAGGLSNDDPIRMSESNSIRHTGFLVGESYTPVQTLASVQRYSPEHAPLYYIFLSGWYRLTNIHPVILRVLSLYFAILTASFIFRLGRFIDPRWGGLIALSLVTFSAYHMFYAHEIRNYGMLALTSCMVIWSYWRLIYHPERSPNLSLAWLYISSVWSVYVHYFGIFTLIGIGVYHLLFFKKNRLWLKVAGIEVLAGITFLPWLPVVLKGATSKSVEEITTESLSLLEIAYQHIFIFGNGLWWLTLILIILAGWYLWTNRHQVTFTRYIVVVALVMFVALVMINVAIPLLPIRRMRYTMVWLPQIMLLMTVGVVALHRFRWLQMLILAGWVGSYIWVNPTPAFLEYTNISDQGSHKYANYQIIIDNQDMLPGQNEVVVSLNHDVWVPPIVLEYYQSLTPYRFVHLTDDLSMFDRPDRMWQFQVNEMKEVANNYSFWLLTNAQYTVVEDVTVFQVAIEETTRECMRYVDTPTDYLGYYVRSDIPCELVNSGYPRLDYDNGLQLLNFVSEQQDNVIMFYTWWDHLPQESYGFSVQLFNEADDKIAQGDYFLPPGTIQISQLDIAGIPAGTYQARLVVYNLNTGTTLAGRVSASGDTFDRIAPIDTVTVGQMSSD